MKNLMIDCSAGMNLFLMNDDVVDSYVDLDEKKHTDELLLKLDMLLKKNNLAIKDIDNLCVCVGPGSFTGVRVAISVVKGLAIGTGAKIYTCSNFDMFDCALQDKSILVLEAFSKNIYIRKLKNNETEDLCISIDELSKFKDYRFFVTTEKMQNVLKNAEIVAKIAKYNAFSCFNSKILKNEYTQINCISPIYLRASQAEIERNKKLGIG